ncbi:hypothetical protein FB567DRAFT_195124 [Paraphoma chrysanthemicola]|uniref:Rhodopsin domain-containing protein n=1 Tax=Paraphoma chrysanthemicola TaxID=798071 RepID=A0A8K0QXA6_9PLEO|nr:hypothetical protein FB567DRAFT_195124 [Paraphoma chrysanthemicola]
MAIPNRGPELVGVNITFVATAFVAYTLRCFVRLKMVKAFGRDDCLMGLALVFFIAYAVSSNIGVKFGTGRHHRDLSQRNIERARHCWYFCYIFYSWAMILAKMSIGFLLLRISVKRLHTWILYLAMATSVIAGGAFFFVTTFQCYPISYFWNRSTQKGACVTNDLIVGLAFTYSLFSIISDFTFAIIPGFLVWNLQLKRRAKIALIPLIAMGCIASAAVIARLPYLVKFNSPDFLYDTTDIAIWSTVEQGLAITAGSLATLRPIFFLAMSRLGFSTQGTRQRPSGAGQSGPLKSPGTYGSQQKSESLRPDVYKLSNVIETRTSHDSGHGDGDVPKSPNWYNGGYQQSSSKESKKVAKKSTADNESEKGLKMKSRNSSEDEEGMHIMVSKSFYITDEERSIAASREGPYR